MRNLLRRARPARLLPVLLPILLPILALAACGDLPQPFLGNPGATARILAQPPTPRLAVPVPAEALLSDQAAVAFSTALAGALQQREVPAVAGPAQPGDWRLEVGAGLQGAAVVPVYRVIDPKGVDRGKTEGSGLPTADWSAATPATLTGAADAAAPRIADLLTGIQATLQHADPNSLYNRPARVQLVPVTGAPGDGNIALTKQMRSVLTTLGPVVQDTLPGADFIVRGTVAMVAIPGDQQRVEIQWSVATPGGDERGRVVQLNDVPAGSLNGYWGDVATAVAQEAAGGVRDVILRQSGRTPGEKPGEKPGAPGSAPAKVGTQATPGSQAAAQAGPQAGVEPVARGASAAAPSSP